MERQIRYTVIKHTDAARYLSETEKRILNMIHGQIEIGRANDGKDDFECVVVEHDWPEYKSTWDAIGKRIDAETHKTLSKKFPGLKA